MTRVDTVRPFVRPTIKFAVAAARPRFGATENDGFKAVSSQSFLKKVSAGVLLTLLSGGVVGSYIQNKETMREQTLLNNQLATLSKKSGLEQTAKVIDQVSPSTVSIIGNKYIGSGVILQ